MTPGFLLVLALLVACSALFSGSETGLYALTRPRLRLRAATGDRAARRLERLLQSPAAMLGALLIGNNLVNFGLTAFVTGAIAEAGWGHPAWWTTLLVSPVMLVFAEMTPKNVFRRRADAWMPRMSVPLTWLRWGLTPLVVPLLLLERLTAGARTETVLSREHLRGLMFQGLEEGLLSAAQHELAHGVMRFTTLPVGRLGVPWAKARTLPAGADRARCIALAREADRSRFPVVAEDGRVVGHLNVHDLIFQPDADPQALVRELPAFAPDTPADEVLRRMGAERRHIALVGTPALPTALVSLEDVVAALVGTPVPAVSPATAA